jgi:hypothetical protein
LARVAEVGGRHHSCRLRRRRGARCRLGTSRSQWSHSPFAHGDTGSDRRRARSRRASSSTSSRRPLIRNTLFEGETLRGLLLTAYAWATVGQIAGYAAVGAFVAGAVMLVLVLLGLRHHHKLAAQQR